MDPNAALLALRGALKDYDDALRREVAEEAAERALEAARALDEWISRGGFLPEAWGGE